MNPAFPIALMASLALPPVAAGGGVPTEIHLLPAGSELQTGDGRGPYRITDAEAVIAASFAERDRIEIDVNHSTFLAAPRGGDAPAVGWITAMHARADGIWGTVEWTERGRELVAGRAYRGISPVLRHEAGSMRVTAILNASLVNRPNLRGLSTLHMEEPAMTWLTEMLGLEADATEEAQRAALAERLGAKPAPEVTALQAQVGEIAAALGLGADADAAAVLAAAQAAAGPAEIVALQSEVAALTTQLNAMADGAKRARAEAFVDGAIAKGRVGIKPLRDRYVTMHMGDPAGTEELVAAMPVLGPSGTAILPPAAKDGEVALNAEDARYAAVFGNTAEAVLATRKSHAAREQR